MTESLLLNITTRCNAQCPFCIVYDSLNRPELDMTDAQIFEAIRRARREGSTEIGYTGGEPSIHHRIVEVVAFAKGLGYTRQAMNTNGIRFKDPAFCRAILEAGLSSVDFSIHGHTDALHDEEVARPGALAAVRKACANLRALRGEYRFDLSATTVVTRRNYRHLREICELLDELGFDNKRLKYAYQGSLRHEAILHEVAPYQEVVPWVIEALDYLARGTKGFHVTHIPLCLLGDHAAFSLDFSRRESWILHRKEARRGDASHTFRKDGDVCTSCAVNHLCTRLDVAYQAQHGRPDLSPFSDLDEVEALFDRAERRFPNVASIVRWTRSLFRANRDAAPPGMRAVEPLRVVEG
jgi:MoaA/NifB/PqqE/SkfB family radical SAM enzyme